MPTARTCKYFSVGTRVSHREYGLGIVLAASNGEHYPKFDNGTTGTTRTRVTAVPS